MCKDVKHTGCTGCNCQAAPFSDLYTGRTRECACVFFKQDVFVLVRISPGMLLSPTFYMPCRIRRKSKGPNTDEQRSQSLRLRKKKQKHLTRVRCLLVIWSPFALLDFPPSSPLLSALSTDACTPDLYLWSTRKSLVRVEQPGRSKLEDQCWTRQDTRTSSLFMSGAADDRLGGGSKT